MLAFLTSLLVELIESLFYLVRRASAAMEASSLSFPFCSVQLPLLEFQLQSLLITAGSTYGVGCS